MSKGLEALEKAREFAAKTLFLCENQYEKDFYEQLDIIEKELKDYEKIKDIRITARFDLDQANKEHKALEIIKNKRIDFGYFIRCIEISNEPLLKYNLTVPPFMRITTNEYNLLKEVLL